jgi:hypothetical protein
MVAPWAGQKVATAVVMAADMAAVDMVVAKVAWVVTAVMVAPWAGPEVATAVMVAATAAAARAAWGDMVAVEVLVR